MHRHDHHYATFSGIHIPLRCDFDRGILGRKEMKGTQGLPRALRLTGQAPRPRQGCMAGSVNVCPGLRGWRQHSHDDDGRVL